MKKYFLVTLLVSVLFESVVYSDNDVTHSNNDVDDDIDEWDEVISDDNEVGYWGGRRSRRGDGDDYDRRRTDRRDDRRRDDWRRRDDRRRRRDRIEPTLSPDSRRRDGWRRDRYRRWTTSNPTTQPTVPTTRPHVHTTEDWRRSRRRYHECKVSGKSCLSKHVNVKFEFIAYYRLLKLMSLVFQALLDLKVGYLQRRCL